MADLHQTSNPDRNAGIDTVGWLFVAVVTAIVAVALVIVYQGSDTQLLENGPVPHLAAR